MPPRIALAVPVFALAMLAPACLSSTPPEAVEAHQAAQKVMLNVYRQAGAASALGFEARTAFCADEYGLRFVDAAGLDSDGQITCNHADGGE